MKVTNWCRNLRVSLLAAGIWVPGAVYAQNITLGDPSFEAFTVPGIGYAYSDAYRPTSAWVDDLDSPPGYTEDDGASHWLYDADYAEDITYTKRASPRTGSQAMHGLANYAAQETSAVFEANKGYTFSIWSQNDEDLNEADGLFMYIFDGTVAFSDANSLANLGGAFTAINARQPDMTAAESQANWTQISIQHNVLPGALEIGHPVGVGFFARKDTAVDDASLRADPINPADFAMFLEVNTTTGEVTIKNETGESVYIDYYEITSADGSLNAADTNWESIQDQGDVFGFPAGDGNGTGWEEFGTARSTVIGESYPVPGASSPVPHSLTTGISLGDAFRTGVGFDQDLVFQYGALLGEFVPLDGDFNGDNVVDAADYVVWRKTIGTPTAYAMWQENFGRTGTGGPTGSSTLVRGFVSYFTPGSGGGGAVPEPSTVLLVGIGLASLALGGRHKFGEN